MFGIEHDKFGARNQRLPLRHHNDALVDVAVKDLRPLRGRPYGPILDPDASTERAGNTAENETTEHNPVPRQNPTGLLACGFWTESRRGVGTH